MIQEFQQNTASMRPAYLGSKDIERLIAIIGFRRVLLGEKHKPDETHHMKYRNELGNRFAEEKTGHFNPSPEWILKKLVDLEYANKDGNMGRTSIQYTDDIMGKKMPLPEEVVAQFECIHQAGIICSGSALYEPSIFTWAERRALKNHLFDGEKKLDSCGRRYCREFYDHLSTTGLTMKEQEFACKI